MKLHSILTSLAACCLTGLLIAEPAHVSAQTSYPMIMSLKPVAVQVGSTTDCEVASRYSMLGAHQVFVSGDGVTAEVVPPEMPALKEGEKPKDVTKLTLRITVASDAQPGPREFRLATPNGASTVGQLVVVIDPVIVEQAKNDTLDTAQAVTLPATLCGAIEKNEDSDFWKFPVEAGQSFVFHVRSQRLQDKIHDLQTHVDPILFLRDPAGNVIAMSDNYFYADPFLAHTFATAGEYSLEIRDVRYTGNVYWEYCIEAHDRPFVTQAFPLAVAAGAEVALSLTGAQLGANPTATVTVPEGIRDRWETTATLESGAVTNPFPLHVTPLPIAVEPQEPHGSPETAVAVNWPVAITGQLQQTAELDVYSFEAKKGDVLKLEVLARRYDSNLDSYLRILNEKGQVLREDDDANVRKLQTADTVIDGWAVPADGTYFVEVRDVHLRGGAGFPYVLEITRVEPQFWLAIDTDKTNVTPGTNAVIFVRAFRQHGFTGEIDLDVDGLPDGVFATCGRIQDGKGQDGMIIISAETTAPLGMNQITIRGTATHPQGEGQSPLELTAVAQPFQEIYMPGGGRSHFVVSDHVVNVGAPSDILSITLSTNELTLKPGDSAQIDVKIERSADAKANVSLAMIYDHLNSVFGNSLPQGVTIDKGKSKTLLASGATEGHITLKVDPTAPPVERQLCSVMAHFSINFVMKSTFSSAPVFITIEPAK